MQAPKGEYEEYEESQLTNTGAEIITSLAIGRDGTNPDQFQLTDDCDSSLPPGGSCAIDVRFQPTTTGTKAARIFADGGVDAGIVRAPLKGTGVRARYTLSATNLAFGNQVVNTVSEARTVNVTNAGSVPLPIVSILLTRGANFSLISDCPAVLSVGSSCQASVSFVPVSRGSKSDTVVLRFGGGAPIGRVALTGTGLTPP